MKIFYTKALSALILLIILLNTSALADVGKYVTKSPAFIENKGQLADDQGKLVPGISHYIQLPGADIYLSANKISYKLYRLSAVQEGTAGSQVLPLGEDLGGASNIDLSLLEVEFVGANPHPEVITNGQSKDYSNYYLGHCPNGIMNVYNYQKIILKNVWKNIDIVFYAPQQGAEGGLPAKQAGLKYDFIVHPGGNPSDIQLRYNNPNVILSTAKDLHPATQNLLTIRTPLGDFNESIPRIYQQSSIIAGSNASPVGGGWEGELSTNFAGSYIKNDNIISFNIPAYNPNEILIIDPLSTWSTYYGGSLQDEITDVAINNSNNVVTSGWAFSTSATFPTSATGGTTAQPNNGGSSDAIIAKFNSDGKLLWSTYYGGNNLDKAYSVAIDLSGNIIVGGECRSTDFPTTTGAYQMQEKEVSGGVNEGFILKLNSTGTIQWATLYGGISPGDLVMGVAVDNVGDIAITGITTSSAPSFPLLFPYQTNIRGFEDAFIAKLNSSDGFPQFSTFYGGDAIDRGFGVAFDGNGDILAVGQTRDNTFPISGGSNGPGAYILKFKGRTDALGTIGTRLWAFIIGPTAISYDVCTGPGNTSYVIGVVSGASFPVLLPLQASMNGPGDAFIASYNPNGVKQWATFYGSPGQETGYGISHRNGLLAITGDSEGDGLSTPESFQPTRGGIADAFMSVLTDNGQQLLCSSYYGGTGLDVGKAVAMDFDGNIVVTGVARSGMTSHTTSVPPGYQQAFAGSSDGFIAKLCANCNSVSNLFISDASGIDLPGTIAICNGDQVQLNTTFTSKYAPPAVGQNITNPASGTYLWSPAVGLSCTTCPNPIASPTVSTTYTVSASYGSDLNGACGGTDAITINVTTVNANAGLDQAIPCTGTANICAVGSGGIAPYTYEWTSGPATQCWNGVGTGTYAVTVTDDNGCLGTDMVDITSAANTLALTLNSSANTICSGQTITLTDVVAGGTPPYTHTWSADASALSGVGPKNIIALTGNRTYTLTVTDANGCSQTQSVNVTVDASKDAGFKYGSGTYCQSGTDPLAIISGNAGTFSASPAGLVFTNTSIGEIDLSASATGTYAVKYSVPAPCAKDSTVSITITTAPDATFSYAAPTTYCPTDADPAPTFPAGSSAGVFSSTVGLVFVSTSSGVIDLSASTPGTYSITNDIAASGGCIAATHTVTNVVINPSKSAAFTYATTSYCSNGANAATTITGNTGGTFSIVPPDPALNTTTGEIDVSTLPAGTYTITYTTTGPCSDAKTQTVTITTAPGAVFSYPNSTYCSDDIDPLPAYPAGNQAGAFTSTTGLVFANQSTGKVDLSASTPGTYTITNTIAATAGAGGCAQEVHQQNLTINLKADATFSYGLSSYCKTASDPAPSITQAGGNFSATPSTGLVFISTSTGLIDLSASTAGTYTITYNIGVPCSDVKTRTITITEPIKAEFTYSAAAYCQGVPNESPTITPGSSNGTFTVSPAGLVFVNNQTGEIDLSASTPGSYTITNTIAATAGAGGCAQEVHVENLTINPQADATFSYAVTSYCKTAANPTPTISQTGGTFSPVSGLSINNATGQINLSASTAGSYTITYNIGGPCPDVKTSTVTITNPQKAVFNYVNATYCPTDVNPMPNYNAGNSAGTFSASPAGLVFVNVNTGEVDLATSIPGMYTITNTIPATTGPGGCSQEVHTESLTINPQADATFSYPATTFCRTVNNVSPTPVQVAGSYSSTPVGLVINTSTGLIDLVGSTAGIYAITHAIAATSTLCADDKQFSITIIDPPGVPVVTSPLTYCQNATATPLSATGTALLWYNSPASGIGSSGIPTPLTTVVGTTNYYVTQTENGCESPREKIEVIVKATPVLSFNNQVTELCEGNAVAFAVSSIPAADTYEFSLDGTNVQSGASTTMALTNLIPGTHTLTALPILNGCIGLALAQVFNVKPLPIDPEPTATKSILCEGETLNLIAQGNSATTYTWTGPNNRTFIGQNQIIINVNPSYAGTYTVTPVLTGCTGTAQTIDVIVNVLPQLSISSPQARICLGEQLTLSGTVSNGLNISGWNWTAQPNGIINDPIAAQTIVQPIVPTVYTLTATSDNGCIGASSVKIRTNPFPVPAAGNDTIVCIGDPVILTGQGGTAGADLLWAPGSIFTTNPTLRTQNLVFNNPQTLDLSFSVTDSGCTAIDSILLQVETCDEYPGVTHVPNAFSPNGDGTNDELILTTKYLVNYNLKIYNRWGEMVFESADLNYNWDGTYAGKLVQQGVYVYQINGKGKDGKAVTKTGTVMVVR